MEYDGIEVPYRGVPDALCSHWALYRSVSEVPVDRVEEGVGGCKDNGIDSLRSRGLWVDLGPDCNRAIASPTRALSTLAGNEGLTNSSGGARSCTSPMALGSCVEFETGSGDANGGADPSKKEESSPFANSVDDGAYTSCCGCKGVGMTSHFKCSFRLCLVIDEWHVCSQRSSHEHLVVVYK